MDIVGTLTLIVGLVSLMGIGLLMAGSFLWPDLAAKYKEEIAGVISALVPIAFGSLLLVVVRAMKGGG
jgi:Na+/melibiose symporter-like transporter